MSDELIRGLEETWAGLRGLLAQVQGDEWARTTPCTEWDVHDLAAHLAAVEGMFQGFPQPQPPEGWSDPREGIDRWTAEGVAARRAWAHDEVLDEVARASDTQLARLRALDEAGWEQETMGPIGPTTMQGLNEIRLFDLYVHLLDLRAALDRPLDVAREPAAVPACATRAITLTPWAAVKKAGVPDGTRIRLDLSGPGGRTADVVVEGKRGRLEEPSGEPSDRIEGSAAAYLLVAAGRPEMAGAAGGVKATGEAAQALLERYRMFQ